jgi:hypothetical protein
MPKTPPNELQLPTDSCESDEEQRISLVQHNRCRLPDMCTPGVLGCLGQAQSHSTGVLPAGNFRGRAIEQPVPTVIQNLHELFHAGTGLTSDIDTRRLANSLFVIWTGIVHLDGRCLGRCHERRGIDKLMADWH